MTESALTKALTELQAELPTIRKENTADTGKFRYSYADLTDVSEKILPELAKHGLAWTTAPTMTRHGFALRYELRHVSGESITGKYPLPNGTPQEIGSAVSYARRYALCAVTGAAPGGDDDDAGTAQKSATPTPNRVAGAVRVALQKINAAQSLVELRDTWETIAPFSGNHASGSACAHAPQSPPRRTNGKPPSKPRSLTSGLPLRFPHDLGVDGRRHHRRPRPRSITKEPLMNNPYMSRPHREPETPLSWMDSAACAQADPDAWFPEKGASVVKQKAICASCPVRVQCVDYAQTTRQQDGLWGGLTAAKLRSRRGPTPPALTPEQIVEIREGRAAGLSNRVLAERFGVSMSTVSAAARGGDEQ